MSDALAAGAIDGFCAGEPWNSLAAGGGAGAIVTTKSAIWQSSPEKVLGLRNQWAEANAETLQQLLAALHGSAVWCANPANFDELTTLLARGHYLGVEAHVIRKGLEGSVIDGVARPDFLMFEARAANFPWKSHALWFFSQMVRWGQIAYSREAERAAFDTFRPDIYRQALAPMGVALPGASSKIEGALRETTFVPAAGGPLALGPDGFFDGVIFDPDHVEDYVCKSPFYDALHND